MARSFGHDFGEVRVHTDAQAAESARAVGALAYTVGRDIVFAGGQYAPETGEGRRLLAHELTHVLQQRNAEQAHSLPVGFGQDPGLESEAARASSAVAAGLAVSVSRSAPPALQRSPDWRDGLAIEFEPIAPTGTLALYTEGGTLSQRLSSDLPAYRGPFCQNSRLPFKCDVNFLTDFANEPRPQPFSTPEASVDFQFAPSQGGFRVSKSDPSPRYDRPGTAMQTSFPSRFDFVLDDNGPFTMIFTLTDKSTGIRRVYVDTIQVEAKRPCA